MFRLQLSWWKQGDWENTVYGPLPYDRALRLLSEYEKMFTEHSYRIIPTGGSK